MSKQKRKHTPRQASSSTPQKTTKNPDGVVTGADYPTEEIKWWREAIEGLVIAIVLALLIRGFEAEAFVIPTGSMAPTLRGRHKDIECEQCGHEYAAGASLDHENAHGNVVLTSCPMCAFPQENNYDKSRDASFAGDRILVNKFSYDPLGEPERYDVIVFKNPNDAKQNYIKRLCGLPGETVHLFRGDIYVRKNDQPPESELSIARKSPKKLRAMLQPIHDTKFIAPILDGKLPPRWQPQGNSSAWTTSDSHRTFDLVDAPNDNWIRYRHIVPDLVEWTAIKGNQAPVLNGARGELITDFYAYNAYLNAKAQFTNNRFHDRNSTFNYWDRSTGKNWVGDLAVECNVDIKSDAGEFMLDLVEGGWHFLCRFDIASGKAILSIQDPAGNVSPFNEAPIAEAQTAVQGAGAYRMLFSNVDSELRLWVNNKLVNFGIPTTYRRAAAGGDKNDMEKSLRPFYGGEDNPGDLAPVGVGGKNCVARVKRLRVHRDKYYVAVKGGLSNDPTDGDYEGGVDSESIHNLFRTPEQWATVEIFDRMQSSEFVLRDFEDDSKDQFFPMGDNSPQSHDARLWSISGNNYVERQFLIGEAVLIYYPHPWRLKVPGEKYRSLPLIFYPKFSRMGLIR